MKERLKNHFFFVAILVFALPFTGKAQDNDAKLIAVRFHADWCRTCKAMAPAFDNLESVMDNSSIRFVKLDFTDKQTEVRTQKTIDELGLDTVVRNYTGTGFILIVDNETKKVREILNKKHSREQMEGIVGRLLKES